MGNCSNPGWELGGGGKGDKENNATVTNAKSTHEKHPKTNLHTKFDPRWKMGKF